MEFELTFISLIHCCLFDRRHAIRQTYLYTGWKYVGYCFWLLISQLLLLTKLSRQEISLEKILLVCCMIEQHRKELDGSVEPIKSILLNPKENYKNRHLFLTNIYMYRTSLQYTQTRARGPIMTWMLFKNFEVVTHVCHLNKKMCVILQRNFTNRLLIAT